MTSSLFRRRISPILQNRSDVKVIAEAADGVAAIEMVAELQPELILMIRCEPRIMSNLAKLNGIEAARRIRALSPMSKILFISQESSADFIEEAFRLGPWGYIVKSALGMELLSAGDAVLRDDKFVGGRLAGYDFSRDS
jgi:DNA-binding NarL/FixJ family response regulator